MPTNNDPLYIGATNWGNLQQQYTQNQLSQATTRQWNTNTGQYDIYWNPAVNIANIPREMQVPTNTGNINTNNLTNQTISGGTNQTAQDQIMAMFGTGQIDSYNAMGLIQSQRDSLLQQDRTNQQNLLDQYNTNLDSALNRNLWGEYQTELQKQGYDQRLADLNKYSSDLRNLTLDYQMGLQNIKRESRLESLTKGRNANLYEQYANEATLINNNIAGVQGDIDRIEKNTNKFFEFLQTQNQNKIDNYTTLRNLAAQNIISLSKEERDNLDKNLEIIQAEVDRGTKEMERKSDALLDAYKNGVDVKAAGISLMDDYETIINKLGPAYRTEMLRKEAASRSGSGALTETDTYSGITDIIDNYISAGADPNTAVEKAMAYAQQYGINYSAKNAQNWRNYANKAQETYKNKVVVPSAIRTTKSLIQPKKTKSWDYTNPSSLANPNEFYANLFGY